MVTAWAEAAPSAENVAPGVQDISDAVKIDVQIAVRRCFHAADPLDRAERARQLLGDGAWCLPQTPGELERDGRGEVAELALGGYSIGSWGRASGEI